MVKNICERFRASGEKSPLPDAQPFQPLLKMVTKLRACRLFAAWLYSRLCGLFLYIIGAKFLGTA
jgi:hypothetical protein